MYDAQRKSVKACCAEQCNARSLHVEIMNYCFALVMLFFLLEDAEWSCELFLLLFVHRINEINFQFRMDITFTDFLSFFLFLLLHHFCSALKFRMDEKMKINGKTSIILL